MVNVVVRVRRLVKSELAVTSVIRLAKISDRLGVLQSARERWRRVAVPNAQDRSRKWLEGGSARGANPSRFVRSSANKQTKQTRLRVLVLSFPLFRLSRSDNLPRRWILRTRREAPARRRYKYGSYTVPQGM